MPIQLLIEIVTALLALAPDTPPVAALGKSAVNILQTGTITPDQELAIRQQLDEVKVVIDRTVP